MKLLKVLLLFLLFSLNLASISFTKANFDLSRVEYYDRVKKVLHLTTEQEAMLEKYGFVVVDISKLYPTNETEDEFVFDPKLRFEDFYYFLVYHNDLPVFVTTDSILHLFHVVFDCSLRILESQTFYDVLLEVTEYAFNNSLNDYNSIPHDDSLKYWTIRNGTVYFGVALSLLTGSNITLPQELSDDIAFYLDHIYAEDPEFVTAGYWILPTSSTCFNWTSVEIKYDFTQFKVRGHYLGEKRLEEYFRTMMWYGQYPIFIPRNDERYIWTAPHFNETVAVYIRDILRKNVQYYEKWLLIYNITKILVGESDSISPLTLENALHKVFGDRDEYLDEVVNGNNLLRLREELSKPVYQQQILSQALVTQTSPLQRYPLTFQFMGQRFVPDSYIFQMLCWDKVGFNNEGERRILPKGLDVFAVLGSERAYQLLIPDFDFKNYEANLNMLKENFTEIDWTHSSYTAWLYALKSLINIEYGEEYPAFMRTLAWQDEKLNTVLGSWAQLRHDTLLYVKQTYIPTLICSYPEAFVEPYPTFYSRMQKLVNRTIEAMSPLGLENIHPAITSALQTLRNVTQKLEVISMKELAKEPLTEEEVEFIKQLAWRCGSGGFIGWYADTVHDIAAAANSSSILEVPVIADVATFPPGDYIYPPQILHVGVGYVNALVVLFPKPDGNLVAAVGPVFSYYEFRLIGTERLNDNEWREMLKWENRTEYLPEWFMDLYGKAEPWPTPEYSSTSILVVAITILTLTVCLLKRKFKITWG